jgi:hypothetical protein
MDKKTLERLQQKASKKSLSGKPAHSTVYVDFANPDHGFILLDDNAEFTKTGILSKHCLKCIIRKDATARTEMDKFAQDKLADLEIKKGKRVDQHVPPAASSAASAQDTYSPFAALALMDAGEQSDGEESLADGIFEDDAENRAGQDIEETNRQIVASFIDQVNRADDEDLGNPDIDVEDKGLDGSNSDDSDDEPPDVVFIGGRPSTNPFACASTDTGDCNRPLAIENGKKKGKGRPLGSKNVKKKGQ